MERGMAMAGEACAAPRAEAVLRGRIFTADPAHPYAEAASVSGGVFTRVGAWEDVRELVGPGTRVIDVGDGLATPGMCDAHMHLSQGAVASMFQADLSGCSSTAEYVERLRAFAAAHPGRSNYQGYGWDNAVFEAEGRAPGCDVLDEVGLDVPIFVRSYDGHSLIASTACLEHAGIGPGYVSRESGEVVCDASGVPTGLFLEWAMRDIMASVEPFSVEDYRRALRQEQERFVRVGVTSIYEPIIDNGAAVRAAYEELDEAGELALKVSSGFYFKPELEDVARLADYAAERDAWRARSAGRRSRFSCETVKLLVDGVVEGQTAYLFEGYAHRPDWRGEPICSPEQLAGAVDAAYDQGFRVHMHAIGDAALDMALTALERAAAGHAGADRRPTITHLQVVRPQDVARMARLGVVAAANPVWHFKEAGYYGELAEPFLGPERAEHEYPLEDLFRAGMVVSMGTDFPVSDPDPLQGVEIGVTRSALGDASGATTLWPEQRASVEQMLGAATAGGAYQNAVEQRCGRIAEGYVADAAVFDRDLTRIDPHEIHTARCVLTMVDGAVVHEA